MTISFADSLITPKEENLRDELCRLAGLSFQQAEEALGRVLDHLVEFDSSLLSALTRYPLTSWQAIGDEFVEENMKNLFEELQSVTPKIFPSTEVALTILAVIDDYVRRRVEGGWPAIAHWKDVLVGRYASTYCDSPLSHTSGPRRAP